MATVKELRAQAKALGIEVPAKAKKAELVELLAAADDVEAIDEAPSGPDVGAEGPTPLSDAPAPSADEHVREPRKGELVVSSPVLHAGKVYPVGAAAPEGLTDEQTERLRRLGALS